MTNSARTTVITIDGPAGAGKSTVAKKLAAKLDFFYLDTGAMYRALTLKALRNEVNFENEEALVSLAKETSIDFKENKEGHLAIFLDEEDVSDEIRSSEVTNNTFFIARAPGVRAIMVELQREIGSRRSIVVEGRDLGTVVFPNATNKFYLDADIDERAKRRINELKEKGKQVVESELKDNLHERDTKDKTREAGPLKKAEDAIEIDSTCLSIEEVVEKILSHIKQEV